MKKNKRERKYRIDTKKEMKIRIQKANKNQ